MSQLNRNSSTPPELKTVFDLIDREEKVDNWFNTVLLVAVVLLFIFGSFVLLS